MPASRILMFGTVLVAATGCGDRTGESGTAPVATIVLQDRIVDASCGQCQLELPGSGCDLAIAIDGSAYYVDGSHIDDHGDAHGPDGLCNAVRRARVTGRLVGGRVTVEELVLLDGDEG